MKRTGAEKAGSREGGGGKDITNLKLGEQCTASLEVFAIVGGFELVEEGLRLFDLRLHRATKGDGTQQIDGSSAGKDEKRSKGKGSL
jgi:hypothetical protein